MKTLDDVQTWHGRKVVDADGDKIGEIEDVYLDRHTGEPAWATVRTGLFGRKVSFVPIRDAVKDDDGEVRVSVQKEQVKNAPKLEAHDDLTTDEERRLYEHYGRSDYDEWKGQDQTADMELGGAGAAPVFVGARLRRFVVVTRVPGDGE